MSLEIDKLCRCSSSRSLCRWGKTANTQHHSPISLSQTELVLYSTAIHMPFRRPSWKAFFLYIIHFSCRYCEVSIQPKAFAHHSTYASDITQAFCVGGKPFLVSSRARTSDVVCCMNWIALKPPSIRKLETAIKVDWLPDRCSTSSQARLVRKQKQRGWHNCGWIILFYRASARNKWALLTKRWAMN